MIDLKELEDALDQCLDCWVPETERPRQCMDMNCCCHIKETKIIEDSPELGLAIVSLILMMVLWTDNFGKVWYLYGC